MNSKLVCRLCDYVPAGVFGVGISPRFVSFTRQLVKPETIRIKQIGTSCSGPIYTQVFSYC